MINGITREFPLKYKLGKRYSDKNNLECKFNQKTQTVVILFAYNIICIINFVKNDF